MARLTFAVHSLKDLPVVGPDELVLAAFPERGSPWDVLVGSSLDGLPPGSVVGTGSPRRVAQLMEVRPDLTTKEPGATSIPDSGRWPSAR